MLAGYGGYENGQVVNPSGAWLDVATSYDSTCALDDAGEITCWGNWDASVLPAGPFTDLSMSDQMGCAWDASSSLTCWTSAGAYTATRRSSDSITHGTCTDSSCYFLTDAGEVELATAGGARTSLESGTYTSVETGMGGFYCLLDTAGELACASGDRGSDSPDAGPFTAVGLGALHACGQRDPGVTCGLTPDGVMACWGVSAGVGRFPRD